MARQFRAVFHLVVWPVTLARFGPWATNDQIEHLECGLVGLRWRIRGVSLPVWLILIPDAGVHKGLRSTIWGGRGVTVAARGSWHTNGNRARGAQSGVPIGYTVSSTPASSASMTLPPD